MHLQLWMLIIKRLPLRVILRLVGLSRPLRESINEEFWRDRCQRLGRPLPLTLFNSGYLRYLALYEEDDRSGVLYSRYGTGKGGRVELPIYDGHQSIRVKKLFGDRFQFILDEYNNIHYQLTVFKLDPLDQSRKIVEISLLGSQPMMQYHLHLLDREGRLFRVEYYYRYVSGELASSLISRHEKVVADDVVEIANSDDYPNRYLTKDGKIFSMREEPPKMIAELAIQIWNQFMIKADTSLWEIIGYNNSAISFWRSGIKMFFDKCLGSTTIDANGRLQGKNQHDLSEYLIRQVVISDHGIAFLDLYDNYYLINKGKLYPQKMGDHLIQLYRIGTEICEIRSR